jgi:hypothetical protein
MKKLVLIVGLVLVAASCQKEQIVPRTAGNTGNNSAIMACPTNDNQDTPTPGTLSSTGTATDDNAGNLEDDGDITDPMRKKDKKGN